MTLRVVGLLRVLLVLAFVCVLLAQVVAVPASLAYVADRSPELASLRWPVTVVAAVGLLCVEVVIIATWKLLTMVKHDRIFSDASMRWLDVIVWAVAVAWVLVVGLFAYFVRWGLSGLPALLLLMVVAGAVLGLLLVVVRALLRQATTLRTDMEAVI